MSNANSTRASRNARLRICVTGSFGNHDIGDEAMLSEDLDFLLDDLGVTRGNVWLIGHDPAYISWYHRHPADNCLSSEWFQARHALRAWGGLRGRARLLAETLRLRGSPELDAARGCDFLLVTGGGTINTRGATARSLRRMHALVVTFRKLGKPVFMTGQTVGPLGVSEADDRLAAEIVESADYLSARDALYSRGYLERLGAGPGRFVETCDDAAALRFEDAGLPAELEEFLSAGECAAVNVTDYTADSDAKRELIAAVVAHVVKDLGMSVVLVAHAPRDQRHLGMVLESLPAEVGGRTRLPDTAEWRAPMLKKLLSRCRVAVGGRYHFVVFAATAGTPFVGMCGNRYSFIKQDGFARQLGLESMVLDEAGSGDLESIKTGLAEALAGGVSLEGAPERPSRSMRDLREWIAGKFPEEA